MKKVFIIGREPAPSYLTNNEIPLIINETEETKHVSRTHARLTVDESGDIFIEDLNSTSGTYVNGLRINHITKVNQDSNITLGKSFRFSLSHPTIVSMTSSKTSQNKNNSVEPVISDDYDYASWGARFGAWILDGIFIYLIGFVFGFIIGAALGDTYISMVITFIATFVIWHFYYAIPLSSGGSTFGKRITGVKVLSAATGNYPSTGQAWGRSICYYLSAVILYIGFLMPLWTKRKQALHDMIAGTIVVKA